MHFTDEEALVMQQEFILDFEKKLQNFSLEDLDRLLMVENENKKNEIS